MRKITIILLAAFILCFSCAFADGNVWVEETWEQVDGEIDCDGLPLVIHAKTLKVPENLEVCEYRLEKLSSEDVIKKGKQIDWAALDCEVSSGEWELPTKSEPVYSFVSGSSLFPLCHLYQFCNMALYNLDPYYMYENSSHEDYIDDSKQIEIKGVSMEKIIHDAEKIAKECGFQLGNMLQASKCDDPEILSERICSYIKRMEQSESYYPKEPAEYAFVDLTFPVYYKGLRLFSGRWTSLENNLEVPNMNMEMVVTPGYGISKVECMLFADNQLQAITDPKPAMSVEEAIHCIAAKYTNMFFQDVKSVTVQSLTLEYVTITGDRASDKPYTLYPAWIAQTCVEWYDESDPYTYYEAYDAVTGRPLF